jgi:hypothetical protein
MEQKRRKSADFPHDIDGEHARCQRILQHRLAYRTENKTLTERVMNGPIVPELIVSF